MDTHEYQAKLILQKYGIPIPSFFTVSSTQEVEEIIKKEDLQEAVLKIQIHAGGRGKAGGVKIARQPSEILSAAKELIGKKVVNHQTGPLGMVSHQILITPLIEIVKEYYLGVTIDRQNGCAILIASPAGGIDIEEVAQNTPDKVLYLKIPLDGSLSSFHFIRIAKFMDWKESLADQGKNIISGLVKAFIETDASLIEINPLALTVDQKLIALDAKLSIDDNALFRHEDLKAFFDASQISPREALAHQLELAYVGLEGNIGCMVNGAGLAMATMDIIQHFGGKPANFLDVGGGATQEKISEGFKIILSDPNVKAILVNIFGGIMNCETIALGINAAASELGMRVPLIVRLEGTNVEQGKALLKESKLKIIIANSLAEAAQKAVEASKS